MTSVFPNHSRLIVHSRHKVRAIDLDLEGEKNNPQLGD